MTAEQRPGPGGPLFEATDVSFAVPGRMLLEGVTLTVQPGRVVGLIGHNGSGKSTLLQILARQKKPLRGSIRFDGRPLGDWAPRAFARRLAYLPQQPPLGAGLLVRELVALGRYPWHGALGRFGREDAAKVADAIELADLGPLADRLVDTLSGGERQRVWLAMLVAQDAACLLLDEPTSALDIGHQVEVLDLIRRLSLERGLGVVAVLHDVNMAAWFCDELVALRQGRLIATGTPDEMMHPDRLRDIFGIPMGVMASPETGWPISYPALDLPRRGTAPAPGPAGWA